MKKGTYIIAFLMIVLCIALNLVQKDDVSATGIARGLMADMRSEISDDKLGDAVGKTKEGRRSVAAYWEAHALLHQVEVYRGLPEDHIPLIEAAILNLKRDGYDVASDEEVISTFFDDSKLIGDEWAQNY